jgi:hypothetical protein
LDLELRRVLEVGVVDVIIEDVEPDLETLEGDLEGEGWAATATERLPLEIEIPAAASIARSSFFATPSKEHPTLSFLHLCARVSFLKSHSFGLSQPISSRTAADSL